jgi:exonuclease VII small subunit
LLEMSNNLEERVVNLEQAVVNLEQAVAKLISSTELVSKGLATLILDVYSERGGGEKQ